MTPLAKSLLLELPGHNEAPAPAHSLQERFASLAGDFRDRPAVGGIDRPWLDHAGLNRQIRQCGFALLSTGLGRGDVVIVSLADGPEALTAILGVASVATVLPLSPEEPEESLEHLLGQVPPAAVIYDCRRHSALERVAQTLGLRQLPITIDPDSPSGCWQFAEPLATAKVPATASRVADAAILFRTAGTTAEPKIVALSQASVLLSADVFADWMELTEADRSLCIMPFSHLHSLVRSTLPGLLCGGTVFCAPGFDRLRILDWLRRRHPTYMTAVPSIYRTMLSRIADTGWSAEGTILRLLASGSDSIDASTVRALRNTFDVPVLEFYGLSEASPMLAGTPSGELAQRNGSVGRALPPWTLTCLDDDGQSTPPGMLGEIAARGGLINPILKRLEQGHQTTVNDWYRTGDLGQLDEEGRLRVTGRVDDRINRGGQKVAPAEVEATLQSHPQVSRALVFPIPDGVFGQRVAAAVISPGATFPTEHELRAHVARHHPDYMVPERVIFVGSLHTNRAGKLDRKSMATQLISESPKPTHEVAERYDLRSATETVLAHIYRQLLEQDRIDLKSDFMTLGGDSFQATSLIMMVEQRFGVLLTPAQFLEHSSVGSMAVLLDSETKGVETPHIATVQEGDHACLLFVGHSARGYAWYADVFARHFQPNQTVYTLEWQRPAGGEKMHETLEHYAASYVDAMLDCEPTGPFCLAGHSFGAHLVFGVGPAALVPRTRGPFRRPHRRRCRPLQTAFRHLPAKPRLAQRLRSVPPPAALLRSASLPWGTGSLSG